MHLHKRDSRNRLKAPANSASELCCFDSARVDRQTRVGHDVSEMIEPICLGIPMRKGQVSLLRLCLGLFVSGRNGSAMFPTLLPGIDDLAWVKANSPVLQVFCPKRRLQVNVSDSETAKLWERTARWSGRRTDMQIHAPWRGQAIVC
eukprot:scaffold332128_cov26-Prasinocladus_malaysianus.AAC.1